MLQVRSSDFLAPPPGVLPVYSVELPNILVLSFSAPLRTKRRTKMLQNPQPRGAENQKVDCPLFYAPLAFRRICARGFHPENLALPSRTSVPILVRRGRRARRRSSVFFFLPATKCRSGRGMGPGHRETGKHPKSHLAVSRVCAPTSHV